MQRGLSVKDNEVVVLQMSLDSVANFEMLIGTILQDRKVDIASNSVDDVLGAWMVVGTSVYKFSKVGLVVFSDDFWYCQVLRNLFRHTQLIETKVGIGSDDCTS
jgi:hypothetical protein